MKEDTKDKKEPLRKPRTYVLDTSALLEAPDIMYKLNGIIVIPLAVIKELDGLKKSDDPNYHVAMAARKVARTLDNFGSYADLKKGVRLSTGGVLAITAAHDDVDGLASEADNKIVGTAVRLKREGHNVTLLTTDGNMRTVARVSGVKGEMPLVDEMENNSSKYIVSKKSTIKKFIMEFLSWILLIIVILIVAGIVTSILTDNESIKKTLWGGILMLAILMGILATMINKDCSTKNYDFHEEESYLDKNFLPLDKSLDEAYICNLPPFSEINKDLKM